MDRRSFLKQVAATAAVGAVAPKVLAEPASFTTPWMPLEPIGYDLRRIEIMYPGIMYPGRIIELEPRSMGITFDLFYQCQIFLDTETVSEA